MRRKMLAMSAVVLGEVWLRGDVVWLRTGAGAGRMMGAGWESYSRTRNPCGAVVWRSQRDQRGGEIE